MRTARLFRENTNKLRISIHRFYGDILPSSEVVIIKKKRDKNENVNLKKDKITKKENVQKEEDNIISSSSEEFRVNEVNIQMISRNIYEQLFKKPTQRVDPQVIKSCQDSLLKHGIDYKKCSHLPDVQLKLPKLEGNDVVKHFYNIGEQQSAPYRELLKRLATCELPQIPKKWSKASGWTKYSGDSQESVPCPPDDALIFDVEVLMSAGKRPTLACAVSTDAWYGWISEPLANDDPHKVFDNINYDDLIPLETDGRKPVGDLNRYRIVVGHNVSFDRAKIKEQYWLDRTGVRFMDTMSMHTCVSGVTSYQRTVLKAKNKEPHPSDDDWIEISSLNNLSEVHKLYCGTPVDKQTRDIFVDGTMEDVHENFQELMQYCANDVVATHEVLKELLPLFLHRFPHPVTLAGMLELGSAYLPVNSNWLQYIDSAETVFEDLKLESRQVLSMKADEACSMLNDNSYKKDLWMWDQDWSVQNLKLKKINTKKKKVTKGKKVEEHQTNKLEEKISDLQKSSYENMPKPDLSKFEVLNEEYIRCLEDFQNCSTEQNEEKIKELSKEFEYLFEFGEHLPVKRPYLPGYPAWYRKLCTKPGKDPDWSPGANNITTSMQITPKLLRLSWEGYPLHYIKEEGWGFLVPYSRRRSDDAEEPLVPIDELVQACPLTFCKDTEFKPDMYSLPKDVEEDLGRRAYYARKKKDEQAAANQYHGLGVWSGIDVQGCCHFLRLPHKDGPKYKVGNPLAKDFLEMFSQNVLSAQGNEAEKVLTFGRMMSYWRNNRERILSQQVVWLPDEFLPLGLRGAWKKYGAIIPQVVVCGTLTRRASEPTWMTASNAHKERVGSELRAMVQAPPGHKFVGADVDSQELWIAALLGDSTLGLCGGSAFGWAVLAGDKSRKTDLHSLTATAAAVSRDHAKVINYARIYGAGQNFAERLLKQFNPTMTVSEAKSKAAKMFSSTKGRRVYRLKKQYMEGFMEEDLDEQVVEMTSYQAMRLAKISGKKLDDMFEKPKWVRGTESDMFNKLEEIADSEGPSTAFLSGRLSRALEHAQGRWGGTRLNWAVQSAAADFLHLMLASMAHLAPKARFCLSFHDEVRYLVSDEYKYETALALQITNLLTRAFCSQRVGINDLPLSVAFFTAVEVDQVLRKESNLNCTTPSNPHGLDKGYGIPNGESLNIFEVLDKCKLNKLDE
ncbi:DNA polymerase subunit gamma-1, mitochondrial [Spodoptera litura]|uniref:DNA-directed DNA polymerase n=1 Tax=Spodoptera litura TaxID=69820 RepID=A0A9J7ENV0_SPOLT|nr:DNA polymerase subunit gamma-1, mitochondrial [Spodoptera litura]